MPGKKGMKHYPLELKLEAMRLFYEEGKTRKEITAMLGIRDKDRVMKWLRQYRREVVKQFIIAIELLLEWIEQREDSNEKIIIEWRNIP